MNHVDLRSERLAGGLTLAAVARAAGTSTSNVSAYERGVERPSGATLGRIRAAIAAGSDSPIHVNRLMTVPAVAAALRMGLRDGWSPGDLLRVVREMRSNARFAGMDQDLAAFYAQPSTTGDRGWDAMLAGVTEMDALRSGRVAPGWVQGHELDRLWFVGSNPALHAIALASTPNSLAVRGVIVDGSSLESV